MKSLTFNGVNSSNYFLIGDIRRNILPPIDIPTLNIPKRSGVIAFPSELNPRTIEVDITIMAENDAHLQNVMRSLASFLYSPTDRRLSFSDDSNFYYYARLSGNTNLQRIASMGEGTLIFYCADPHQYSINERDITLDQEYTRVFNNGSALTYPIIQVTPIGSDVTTYINLKNETTGRTLQLNVTGEPFVRDTTYQIDMNINDVYRYQDGQSFLRTVDVMSDFWGLQRGENLIRAVPTPPNNMEVRMIYRERFL